MISNFQGCCTRRSNGPGFRIISTRNLHPVYNVGCLIDSLPLLLEHMDVNAVICGEGPERDSLEGRVSELGLEDRVTFRGYLPPEALAGELRSADLYVSTSRSDSTSVSLLEAMACGLPPVVTDIPANREWIEEGENGLLVRPGDPALLAGACRRMLEDREMIAGARRFNLDLVRERGLWSRNMEAVELAFTRLAENSGEGTGINR